MRIALVLCVALVLAACGEDDAAKNETRFVDQDRIHSPFVDTESVDMAVHTEALTHMGLIHRQVKFKASTSGDPAALYRSIVGRVNGTTLGKIGLSESDLQGSFYRASDYTIAISGKTMTISAAQLESRGRVDPQEFKLP